uniref:Uncharacterized protein n=1 Tax=Mus spicilegus TaxID=10103 RepID=A0A8C6GJG7_MUSSI
MSAFGDFVSLCSSGCHGTRFVDQPGRLELLEIPLPLPPESWLGGTKGGSQTTTISGTNRNTFRVLRPPEQPVRKNNMSAGAKSRGGREDSESPGTQRSNSSEASSGDFLDLKGEGDMHENVDTDCQANLAQMEEKLVPNAPVPSPMAPAPVPSRRNPPGGKSSLVLG